MPLTPGAPVSDTIRELHGGNTFAKTAAKFGVERARKQSIAIALSNHRKADGGGVAVGHYDIGGGVDPVTSVINALNAGNASGGSSPMGATNQAAPSSQTQTATTNGVAPPPSVASPSIVPNANPAIASTTANPATSSTPMGVAAPVANQTALAAPTTPPTATQPAAPIANKLMAGGGSLMGGSRFDSLKPPAAPSWNERQVARMHTGALTGSTPGRADKVLTKVPSGSYVLPARHVAAMGDGNSIAGLSLAHKMFSGPYGTSLPKVTHGSGAPRPPAPFKQPKFADGGEVGMDSDGVEYGHPVDVALSDGEYVCSPQSLIARYGSLREAHNILDKWVKDTIKKEAEIHRKLPPPVKE